MELYDKLDILHLELPKIIFATKHPVTVMSTYVIDCIKDYADPVPASVINCICICIYFIEQLRFLEFVSASFNIALLR